MCKCLIFIIIVIFFFFENIIADVDDDFHSRRGHLCLFVKTSFRTSLKIGKTLGMEGFVTVGACIFISSKKKI